LQFDAAFAAIVNVRLPIGHDDRFRAGKLDRNDLSKLCRAPMGVFAIDRGTAFIDPPQDIAQLDRQRAKTAVVILRQASLLK
jgi:hypothetical protein